MRHLPPFLQAPLLLPACSLIAGIAIGSRVSAGVPWSAVLATCVVSALLTWRWGRLQTVLVMGCFVLFGIVLARHHRQQLQVVWPEGKVSYQAVVISEPVAKPRSVAVDLLLTASGRRLKAYIGLDSLSSYSSAATSLSCDSSSVASGLGLQIGDGIAVCSRIRPVSQWRRGTFDYRRYLEVHGFTGTTYIPAHQWQRQAVSLVTLPRTERARLRFLRWRSRLLQRLRLAGLQDNEYSVVAAMALGSKTALSRELREVYGVSGASHVLALSGLHLGILFGLLSLLTFGRRLRMLTVLTAVPALWAFVLLVGMPASVVRSALMLSVYALFMLASRHRRPLGVLALTAIVMLVANPWSLFDVGFQLSFLSMLAILVVGPLLYGLLSARWLQRHPFVRALWGLSVVSVAAQIGVAPLVAYYFCRFSTYFLLTNFIVIPAATLILYLSLASLVIPQIAWLLAIAVGALNAAVTMVSELPFASISDLHPTALQTVAAYVLAAALVGITALWGPLRRIKAWNK